MGFKEILNERIEAEGEDYEIVSGKGRIRMVTFIKRDGIIHCANYAFLHGVSGGEGEVRLDFARYMVVIKGRNLGGVQKALADHRLAFVKESDPSRISTSNSTRVDQIYILHGRKESGESGLSSAAAAVLRVHKGWSDLSGRKRLQTPRLNRHSSQPDHGGGKVKGGHEMAVEAIEARGDAPEVFELVEAPLPQIELLVDLLVLGDRPLAGACRWNDHAHPFGSDQVPESPAVITFVGDDRLGLDPCQQRGST